MPKVLTYPFSEKDMEIAAKEWGANCGPAALAFALQIPIGEVKDKIPGFAGKGYTSPTMMKSALENCGRGFITWKPEVVNMFGLESIRLVRVQWSGPWTKPGSNPKWAYRQTHWLCSFAREFIGETLQIVFDCNGGIMPFAEWKEKIVPVLTSCYSRADGGWFPTHIWEIV